MNSLSVAWAALLLVAAVPAVRATPPNTTPAGAVSYEVGEGWVSSYYDESTQTRWWSYGENPGRSYCVEAVQGSVSPIPLDPNVAVYSDAAGTVPLVVNSVTIANNNGGNDPDFLEGARACYIAPGSASVIRTLKVNVPVGAGSGDSGYIKLRVVDTTLQVPYWEAKYDATNGGFFPSSNSSGTNINTNNRSTATIHYLITYFPPSRATMNTTFSGTIAPSDQKTLSPNGNATAGGNGLLSGSAIIAHDGPPGSVRALVVQSSGSFSYLAPSN